MPRILVFALCLVALAAPALSGCEKPDRSYVTSPTVKTLVGTTIGNTVFNPPESPPAEQAPPDKWQLDFGLARWSELENGAPSLELIAQVSTRPGASLEVWLESADQTIVKWTAGSTAVFVGTICFQLELENAGEAAPLGPGAHTATMVFRDPSSGVIAAGKLQVTHTLPKLEGVTPPADGGGVMREALACRRGQ